MTVWCTQKAMGMLFDSSIDNRGLHLKNIYDSGELEEKATTEIFSVVRQEGSGEVTRSLHFYNLDAVISVGLISSVSYPIAYQCPFYALPRRRIGTRCSLPCQPNLCWA